MDMEIEGPIDDAEALFAEDDEELLGAGATTTTKPSNNPWAC